MYKKFIRGVVLLKNCKLNVQIKTRLTSVNGQIIVKISKLLETWKMQIVKTQDEANLLREKRFENTQGGQPEKIVVVDDNFISEMESFAYVQMNYEQIGQALGLNELEFIAVRKEHPHFNQIIERARQRAISQVSNALIKNALKNENVNAQKFFLERKGGWHNTNKIEVTGANGAPLGIGNVNIDVNTTDEQAAQLYQELLKIPVKQAKNE